MSALSFCLIYQHRREVGKISVGKSSISYFEKITLTLLLRLSMKTNIRVYKRVTARP